MRSRNNIKITVDDDFYIEVDNYNWTVWQRIDSKELDKNRKPTGKMKKRWIEVAYCHDLPAALKNIAKEKARMELSSLHIRDFLAWYDTTTHSMLNRILDQKEHLRKAEEKNKVLIARS